MKNKILSEREAAKILGMSHQTLGNYRRAGKGPTCTVIEGFSKNSIFYQFEIIIEWKKNYKSNHAHD